MLNAIIGCVGSAILLLGTGETRGAIADREPQERAQGVCFSGDLTYWMTVLESETLDLYATRIAYDVVRQIPDGHATVLAWLASGSPAQREFAARVIWCFRDVSDLGVLETLLKQDAPQGGLLRHVHYSVSKLTIQLMLPIEPATPEEFFRKGRTTIEPNLNEIAKFQPRWAMGTRAWTEKRVWLFCGESGKSPDLYGWDKIEPYGTLLEVLQQGPGEVVVPLFFDWLKRQDINDERDMAILRYRLLPLAVVLQRHIGPISFGPDFALEDDPTVRTLRLREELLAWWSAHRSENSTGWIRSQLEAAGYVFDEPEDAKAVLQVLQRAIQNGTPQQAYGAARLCTALFPTLPAIILPGDFFDEHVNERGDAASDGSILVHLLRESARTQMDRYVQLESRRLVYKPGAGTFTEMDRSEP